MTCPRCECEENLENCICDDAGCMECCGGFGDGKCGEHEEKENKK